MLVSDGAGVIDRRVQEKLRAAFRKRPVNLYWVFLRTANSPGIFEHARSRRAGYRRQSTPSGICIAFSRISKIPYRAFEAENPQAVGDAIAEIGRLEQQSDCLYRAHAAAQSAPAPLMRLRWRRWRCWRSPNLPKSAPARREAGMRQAQHGFSRLLAADVIQSAGVDSGARRSPPALPRWFC